MYEKCEDVDTIIRDTIKEFLDSDMTALPDAVRLAFKQTEFADGLIQSMVGKIIYHEQKLTIFINIADTAYLQPFKHDALNPTSNAMPCYITDDGKLLLSKNRFI